MKRSITILGLAALAAAHVQAQTAPPAPPAPITSVTLYGLIDSGVEYLSNVGAGHERLIRMPGLTGSLPSRLGFRGSEDLGGGLRAVYTLEAGFSPDSGVFNQGGRAFGRQAFVGLSGGWGTLSLGRQYTMLYWALLEGDQLGPNNYGLGSFDAYIPNARVDNSVAYRGTFAGLTLGATYSVGRDAVNAGPSPAGTNCAGENGADPSACREWSAMLKYDAPAWGAALAIDRLHGGAGAFGGLVRSDLKDRRITLNGYAKFGPARLDAGVIRRDNDAAAAASAANGATPRSDLAWIGGAWTINQLFVLDGQVQRLDFKDGGDKSTLTVVRGSYYLSRRTVLYAMAAHIGNGSRLAFSASSGQAGGAPLAGGSQNGVMAGMRHSF